MISAKNLASVLLEISKESRPTEKVMSSFYNFLEKNRLYYLLPQVLSYLENLQKKETRFKTLEIVSGLPIDKETSDNIVKTLKIERASLIKKDTDPEIIGGFIATYKGFIYDASLRRQINLLKAKLIEN